MFAFQGVEKGCIGNEWVKVNSGEFFLVLVCYTLALGIIYSLNISCWVKRNDDTGIFVQVL